MEGKYLHHGLLNLNISILFELIFEINPITRTKDTYKSIRVDCYLLFKKYSKETTILANRFNLGGRVKQIN